MTDLHALLHEPWCSKCGAPQRTDCMGCDIRPPLATHMPEAVPARLEWSYVGRCWRLLVVTGEHDYLATITDEQAETQFIGTVAKNFPATAVHVLVHYAQGEVPNLPDALTAALHRLADERDAAKETTDG